MSKFKFTDCQAGCYDYVVNHAWNSDDQLCIYAGPAGTGKTTIVPYIVEKLPYTMDEILFVAFTGKSASVLSRRGLPTNTIHSSMMELKEFPKLIDGKPILRNGRPVMVERFVPKTKLDPKYKAIWLEESMNVSKQLYDIIISFGLPVFGSGDEHQLPPIYGSSPFVEHIGYRLKEITRQAKGSPIIQLSTIFREGKSFRNMYNIDNIARIKPVEFMNIDVLSNASVILTNKNKTRESINNTMRKFYGHSTSYPQVGEKLVCRSNNRNAVLNGMPLVNGTSGIVVNPLRRSECNFKSNLYTIDFMPDYIYDEDGSDYYSELLCDYEYLNQPCGMKEIDKYNKGNKMEFGYALTTYLSQGSQYNDVVYIDEIMGNRDFMNKARYTAVTRAVNSFVMYI